ncbi:MAG: four helix bundle protein [Cytophagaceae bacterium]|nr:four helix bundle protein [Gemmatimonadaceae bacterium]
MNLVAAAYVAAGHYPTCERYVLSAQLRRAAISVVANITEGYARPGPRQLRAFLDIAYASARECDVLLLVSVRVGALTKLQAAPVHSTTSIVSRQLLALLRALRAGSG